MSSLTPDQIQLQLETLNGWQANENGIFKSYEFADFASAIAFMTQSAFYAQELEHYPTWENYFNTVTVKLGNGGRDIQLAKRLETVFNHA